MTKRETEKDSMKWVL